MEPVTNITLAVTLSLATAFSGGLEALNTEDYSGGVSQLTSVVESEASFNTLRPMALLYRAECHLGLNATNEVRSDLIRVLETSQDKAILRRAEVLYRKAGLNEEDLAPRESPEDIWYIFSAALIGADDDVVISHCTGQWLKTMESYMRSRHTDWFNTYSMQLLSAEIVEERIGTKKDKGKAWLSIKMGRQSFGRHGIHSDETGYVEFVQEGGRWLIRMLANSGTVQNRSYVVSKKDRNTNRQRLRSVHRGLITYYTGNDHKYPSSLQKLAETHVDGKDFFWQHPETQVAMPFIYCSTLPNLTNSNPIAAVEPVSTDSSRLALYINGDIRPVTDDELAAIARLQAWPQLLKDGDSRSGAKLKKKIEKLIKKLRTGNSAKRRKSRTALNELGIAAFPYLEAYVNDTDPEIQETVQRILGK